MLRKSFGILPDAFWILFWGAVSSYWCISAANHLSATFDEPFQLEEALRSWRTGSFKPLLNVGTMPLPLWFNTGPLYVWERWQGRPFDFQTEMDTLLPIARATALVFWWLLLGYGMAAGRQVGGPWGGRLAVVVLACEPTLLAHAALATADVALTVCLLALFVHYRSGRARGWLLRVGVPSLWFGAALATKASAIVFGLIGMGVLEVEYRLRDRSDLTRMLGYLRAGFWTLFERTSRRQILQVFWIGLLLTFLFCGSDWQPSASFVKWANGLPEGAWSSSMCWLSQNLCIFSNAGNALAYQIRRNMMTQEVFLLGSAYQRALWYYFPVALSMKLTLPLLALPLLLAGLSPRSLRNWVCVVAGILLLYSLNCRVQIGVRLLLPLVGLAAVGLAATLVRAIRELPFGWRRHALVVAAVAIPLWMGGEAWTSWPDGLRYVNEMWGGSAEGYKLVSDSNYDWGQGLKELLAWQQQSKARTVDVIYFGCDPLVAQPPFHKLDIGGWPSPGPEALQTDARSAYVAVSTTFLYGTLDNVPRFRPLVALFRAASPVARTSTFLIYDLRQMEGQARNGR